MDPMESARNAFAEAFRPVASRPDVNTLLATAGWTREQLDSVAAAAVFPPLPATLALIGAAGGDTSAWEQYWRQTAAVLGVDAGPESAAQALTAPIPAGSLNLPAMPTIPVAVGGQGGGQAAGPDNAPAGSVPTTPANAAPAPQQQAPQQQAHQPAAPINAPSRAPFAFEPLEADDPREIGGYKLRARLGAGGMGRVFLSYTPGGRPLALKVVRDEFANDPEFRSRFQQETGAAQRVHGLYTAQVVDFDANAQRPWLATAFVPGPALSQAVVAYGTLPVSSVRLLMAGVAEALAAIHAAGVVHRDLKPSNVLLAADGPKVIDFGIARAVDATPLTSSGMQIGTPMFMAPEQVLGKSATSATDVHALGALALYAAVRRAPYGEGNAHAVMYRIMNEQPDLADCPEELKPLIARCLDKDPANRPTPAEIVAELAKGAAEGTSLKMTDGWLPSAVVAEIAARTTARVPEERPEPPTAALPIEAPARPAKKKSSWKLRLGLVAALVLIGGAGGAYAAMSLTKSDHKGTTNAGATQPNVGQGAVSQSPTGAATSQDAGAPTTAAPADQPSDGDLSATPSTSASIGSVVPGSGYLLGEAIIPDTPNIDIAQGYGLDFNRSATKAVQDGGDFEYTHDGYPTYPAITYPNETVQLDKGTKGDFQTCNDDTRYNKDSTTPLSLLPIGTQFCVHSKNGVIALVTLTGKPDPNAKSDYITVDVIVWQGQIDGNN